MEVNSLSLERGTVQLKVENYSNENKLKTKMKNEKTFMKTSLDFRDGVWAGNCKILQRNCSKAVGLFGSQTSYQIFHKLHSFWCLRNFLRTSIVVMLLFQILVPVCESCYVFPPGKKNPCANKRCSLGAICVSTKDGTDSRCVCPLVCYHYGNSDDNIPVCGNNGKDYDNYCELRKDSCESMTEIKVKDYGRCGKYHGSRTRCKMP